MTAIKISMFSRWVLSMGAGFALLAVLAGAFAAHALKTMIEPGQLEIFATAARYQMYHAFALLVVGLLSLTRQFSAAILIATAAAFMFGIILFSGSLYLLAFGAPRWLGPITPLGGGAFVIGWLMLMVAVLKRAPARS